MTERGKPEYPEELYRLRIGGEVTAELRFDGPDSPPAVEFNGRQARSELELEVYRHVRQFRVPCLAQEEAPLRLTQTYAFLPHDGRKVTWSPPRDADEARQQRLLACASHPGRAAFAYPGTALRAGETGQVAVRMTFTSADAAPDVQALVKPLSARLTKDALDKALGYRMPCHVGAPVTLIKVFDYLIEGVGQRHALDDMGLMRFLGAVRNLDDTPVSFDLDRMGCPFDLRVRHMRPHASNDVGEIGGTRPERRPLMDWIATLELELPDASIANAVYGDEFTLTIPCGKIDL